MADNRTLGPGPSPKRHLFIDTDYLIEWEPIVEQRCYQARKVPITGLECGPPGSWDARITGGSGSALVEDGVFRMWYACMPDAESYAEGADHPLACYAESDDGIHWRKPDLKITGQHRWPGNNLIKLPGWVMSVVRALPGAGVRYLALCIQWPPLEPDVCDDGTIECNGPGTYLFGSDDGLHWRQLTKYPIIVHGDCAYLHVDELRGRYLLYHKVGLIHGLTSRRSTIVIESKDGIHWEGYDGYRQWRECFVPDDYDDLIAAQRGFKIADHYSQTFHQVGSLYLAVQNVFTIGLPLRYRLSQNPNGLSHLRVAFSHDGTHWRYPRGRPPFLEVGRPGEFDAGFLSAISNIVEHDDEQWLYYSALRYAHGWCITPEFKLRTDIPLEEQRHYAEFCGLAKIKRNRFASLAVTWKGRFDVEAGERHGNELFINARCPRGAIRVAVAEQGFRLHHYASPRKSDNLPGFSFEDCVPFTGDSVKAPLRFRNASVASIPADKRLVLRFEVFAGEVFGYEWDN